MRPFTTQLIKQIFTAVLLTLLLVPSTTNAQIQIDNNWLPSTGQVFPLGQAVLTPNQIDQLTRKGGDIEWQFGQFDQTGTTASVFANASGHIAFQQFPTADIINTTDSTNTRDGEASFLKYDGNKLLFLGGVANSTSGVPDSVVSYKDPFIYQLAGLSFGDSGSNEASIEFPLAKSDIESIIPDSIKQLLSTIDSFKLTITAETIYEIDGWGTVAYDGKVANVLRKSEISKLNTGLQLKAPFVGWIDAARIAPNISNMLPDLNNPLVTYEWLSPSVEIPVVTVNLDTINETASASFVLNSLKPTSNDNVLDASELKTYFTSINQLEVEHPAFKNTGYSVRVYGLLGTELLRQDVLPQNTKTSLNMNNHLDQVMLVTIWKGDQLIGTKKVSR